MTFTKCNALMGHIASQPHFLSLLPSVSIKSTIISLVSEKSKIFLAIHMHKFHVAKWLVDVVAAAAAFGLMAFPIRTINFTHVEILLNRNRFINDHESVFLTLIVYIFINCSLIYDKNLMMY